ncbi:hypothetical protein YC2023_089325 [Brassica napus]
MTVGRNGALSMAVRCPIGDSACGDHIVFGHSLLHRATTGAYLLHRATTRAAHLPRATTGASLLVFFIDLSLHAVTSLLHRATTACHSFSSSPSHHWSFSSSPSHHRSFSSSPSHHRSFSSASSHHRRSNESRFGCLLYLIDVIVSLISGRLVRDRIGLAMVSAVQSQLMVNKEVSGLHVTSLSSDGEQGSFSMRG